MTLGKLILGVAGGILLATGVAWLSIYGLASARQQVVDSQRSGTLAKFSHDQEKEIAILKKLDAENTFIEVVAICKEQNSVSDGEKPNDRQIDAIIGCGARFGKSFSKNQFM